MQVWMVVSAVDIDPVDFSSDVGRVRALIPDTEKVDFTGEGVPSYIFTDQHIASFLSNHPVDDDAPSAHIYWAAKDAVEALAASEALISKVIRTEDLQTDGAKVANALLGRAARLGQEAERQEEDGGITAFTIVDFQPQPPETLPQDFWRGFPKIVGHRELDC